MAVEARRVCDRILNTTQEIPHAVLRSRGDRRPAARTTDRGVIRAGADLRFTRRERFAGWNPRPPVHARSNPDGAAATRKRRQRRYRSVARHLSSPADLPHRCLDLAGIHGYAPVLSRRVRVRHRADLRRRAGYRLDRSGSGPPKLKPASLVNLHQGRIAGLVSQQRPDEARPYSQLRWNWLWNRFRYDQLHRRQSGLV